MNNLGTRAIACKGWRWTSGMAVIEDGFRGFVYNGRHIIDEAGVSKIPISDTTLPDLADPATIGCLLAMVRDAHKDAYVYAACIGTEDNEWEVFDYCEVSIAGTHRGEARALVAALEAAGGEERHLNKGRGER